MKFNCVDDFRGGTEDGALEAARRAAYMDGYNRGLNVGHGEFAQAKQVADEAMAALEQMCAHFKDTTEKFEELAGRLASTQRMVSVMAFQLCLAQNLDPTPENAALVVAVTEKAIKERDQ